MAEPRERSPSSDYEMKWEKKRGKVPIGSSPRAAVSIGKRVYITDGLHVCEYHTITEQLLTLPSCVVQGFSLANIQGSLTTVGGHYHVGSSGLVKSAPHCFSWDGASRRWVKRYPPLPTTNLYPAVATTADHVIAIVGLMEVMDISTGQWSTVAGIPASFIALSAAVCKGIVYVVACDIQDAAIIHDADHMYQAVLYCCSLDVLLKSSPHQSRVWHRIDCLQHSKRSSLITVNNKLLWLRQKFNELGVFLYEEAEETFTELEASTIELHCRYICAAALSGQRVLVMDDTTVLMGELFSAGNESSVSFILVQATLNSLSLFIRSQRVHIQKAKVGS